MVTLSKGDKAPQFTLFNTDKQQISLADYQGKNVLVLFFPLAFTGVCTAELCNTRDELSIYQNLNTEVLAISVDSVFVLDQFKKQQAYNFPLLSDFNKTTAKAYGAYYDQFVLDMEGVAKRAAFIVDKNGDIAYAEVLEDAGKQPDFELIKETLKAIN